MATLDRPENNGGNNEESKAMEYNKQKMMFQHQLEEMRKFLTPEQNFELIRQKHQFMSNMSHELLTIYSQILVAQYMGQINQYKKMLDKSFCPPE